MTVNRLWVFRSDRAPLNLSILNPQPSLARRSYSPTHSNHRSSFLLLRPAEIARINIREGSRR
ncbi:hypothetical protein Hdeb2414_s0014g00421781 [Helianthus debilis subsp. tardiflorus]